MAPTLKVNFAGVSMPNPFMLSSAPPHHQRRDGGKVF